MNDLLSWLAMGGYAAYVWPTYGLVSFIVIANCIVIKQQRQRIKKLLQHLSEVEE